MSWDNPGDGSTTRYQVRERPASESGWWCWTSIRRSGPGTVAHTVTGLSGSIAYRFQIRAANARGAGAAGEAAATTAAAASPPGSAPAAPSTAAAASPPGSAPAAPSGLAGVGGDRSIALNWNNPTDSTITEYQFRERPSGQTAWRCWRRIWTSTSATVGHTMRWITNGTLYQVQLRALNAAGAGPPSQTAATPTPTRTPPGP